MGERTIMRSGDKYLEEVPERLVASTTMANIHLTIEPLEGPRLTSIVIFPPPLSCLFT